VLFAEHAGKGGGTTVVVRWTLLNATDAERAAFAAGHGSMEQGWGGTMEQLAAHLVALQGASGR
jgi:hypothetical protein